MLTRMDTGELAAQAVELEARLEWTLPKLLQDLLDGGFEIAMLT